MGNGLRRLDGRRKGVFVWVDIGENMGRSQRSLAIGYDFDFVVHHDCAGKCTFIDFDYGDVIIFGD